MMWMPNRTFFLSPRRALLSNLTLLGALLLATSAPAETAFVEAGRDATLIERMDGSLANGAGPAFFVGRTSGTRNSLRRALLSFDVAAVIPAGAWVTRVELELELMRSNATAIDLGLHRVLTIWSEGPSSTSGGAGSPAEPGDATWLHSRFETDFWANAGGDFEVEASSITSVGAAGLYAWGSTLGMIADVQDWLDNPSENFGWILVGGEDTPQTAKRFSSRESEAETSRPLLVIEYETSCEGAGLVSGALGSCRAYCEALECGNAEPRGSRRACMRLARSFARQAPDQSLPCEPQSFLRDSRFDQSGE
jgi:hypothetical protein